MGSLEEYFLLLTRKLGDRGCRSIFCFDRQPESHLVDAYRSAGAELRVTKLTNSRLDVSSIRELMALYRSEQATVLNAHFGHTGINALIAARLSGIPRRVWTKHSLDAISYKGGLPHFRRWLHTINWESIWATDVIAVSGAVRKELADHFITRNVHQFYLGVVRERFRNGRADPSKRSELGIPENRVVIACISQARPEKGVEYLVRALGRLRNDQGRPYALIVGGGPLTDDLEALARHLGIEGDTRFCGVRNDVEDILALSDFTVLPSLEEAAGLVIMESLAAGKPAIASRVGGIPEIIGDGVNGLLVAPGREIELADAIRRLCNKDDLLERLTAGAIASGAALDVEYGVQQTLNVYFGGN